MKICLRRNPALPYSVLSESTGRASNAEKQPTGPSPEGCDENGPAAALLVGHVPHQLRAAEANQTATNLKLVRDAPSSRLADGPF